MAELTEAQVATRAALVATISLVALVGSCMRWKPEYDVWQQGLEGQAALARATQDRQIKVQEAEAARDSAKLLAEAEVIRSRGAAEANKIMQEGLGGPENFLRWKYISMLDEGKGGAQREIIYVPMDGVLPITEATRAAPIQKAPPIADKK